ncbi:hypothetical protein [Aeromonas simiae]
MPFHLFLLLTLLLNTALAADTPSAASGSEPAPTNAPSGAESSAPAAPSAASGSEPAPTNAPSGAESTAPAAPSAASGSEPAPTNAPSDAESTAPDAPSAASNSEPAPANAPSGAESTAPADGEESDVAGGEAAPPSTPAPPPPTSADDRMLRQDWQRTPASKQLEQDQVLFAEHRGEHYLGLVLLLPEWQGSATLWQLSPALTTMGFDTLLLLPHSNQGALNPADEKKSKLRDDFRHYLSDRITRLSEAKLQEGGFRLILAQGSAAAWVSNLIASEQLPAPDALVLLDAAFPDSAANLVLARDVARAPAPVLDLYREEGSLWSRSAAEARRIESKRGSKLDYRPYALADTEEIPGQLQGWLHHLGWL